MQHPALVCGEPNRNSVSLKFQPASQSYLDLFPQSSSEFKRACSLTVDMYYSADFQENGKGKQETTLGIFSFSSSKKAHSLPHHHKSRYLKSKQKLENLLFFP